MPSTPAASMGSRDLLKISIVVLIWGVNFIVMKWGLSEFTPFELGGLRYFWAAFPLILFIPRPKVRARWVVMFGLSQGVGQFGFLFIGMHVGMTAALASVLLQTQVFFTALFAFYMLQERPGRPLQIGMALAAAGLLCFAMNYLSEGNSASGTTLAGLLFALCAAAMWACSNIITRLAQQESPDYDPLAFVGWACAVPVLPFIALSAWFDPDITRWLQLPSWQAVSWRAWASIGFLAWAATLVGYGMWTGLLKRFAANRVAPFSLGVPVIGMAAGMWVLNEVITPWQWCGVLFVVLALLCVILGPRLQTKYASKP